MLKVELIEKSMMNQNEISNKHEEEIQIIFNALKQLLSSPKEPRVAIGFNTKNNK